LPEKSGEPDRTESAWLQWVSVAEGLLGHDLDGNDVNAAGCGYSLDEAHERFNAGMSPSQYASTVRSRARYRAPD